MRSGAGASSPRWRNIADALMRDVIAGTFGKERLPTEQELAVRFSVNRHTIRRAVAALVEQGLLSVEQGRGTFVIGQQVEYLVGRRTRFSENLHRAGLDPSHRVLAIATAPAGPFADVLGVSLDDDVFEVEMLGEAEHVPMTLATHRFAARRFPDLPEALERTQSVTTALLSCGVTDYTRRSTRIVARLPDKREADLLQQPITRPILQADSVNVDRGGNVIHCSTTLFAGDRVQLVVEPDTEGS